MYLALAESPMGRPSNGSYIQYDIYYGLTAVKSAKLALSVFVFLFTSSMCNFEISGCASMQYTRVYQNLRFDSY